MFCEHVTQIEKIIVPITQIVTDRLCQGASAQLFQLYGCPGCPRVYQDVSNVSSNVPFPPRVVQSVNNVQQSSQSTEIEVIPRRLLREQLIARFDYVIAFL